MSRSQDVWKMTGELFGYPRCCVAEFCERLRNSVVLTTNDDQKLAIKWIHSAGLIGFVPCKCCAAKLIKDSGNVEIEERGQFYRNALNQMMPQRRFRAYKKTRTP